MKEFPVASTSSSPFLRIFSFLSLSVSPLYLFVSILSLFISLLSLFGSVLYLSFSLISLSVSLLYISVSPPSSYLPVSLLSSYLSPFFIFILYPTPFSLYPSTFHLYLSISLSIHRSRIGIISTQFNSPKFQLQLPSWRASRTSIDLRATSLPGLGVSLHFSRWS